MLNEILFMILGITVGGMAASAFWFYRDTRYINELEQGVGYACDDYRKEVKTYREQLRNYQNLNLKLSGAKYRLERENSELRRRLHALENENAARRLSETDSDSPDSIKFN